MINLKWANTKTVTCDAGDLALEKRTRTVILLQENKEMQ